MKGLIYVGCIGASLEGRRAAVFDEKDHGCFDFRFASRLLLVE